MGVHLLSGCSGNPEYLVQLVEDVSDPGEAGVAVHHLHEDAAGPPHIQTGSDCQLSVKPCTNLIIEMKLPIRDPNNTKEELKCVFCFFYLVV